MCRFMLAAALALGFVPSAIAADPIASVKSGNWSDPATWDVGKVPGAGAQVLVSSGNTVVYDLKSDTVIRGVSISGVLTFAPDKETVLNVGVLKVQASDKYSEDGFDCDHSVEDGGITPAARLSVGTPDRPIEKNATIRLHYVEGMNKESCPAVVCCGGRMEFHGQPMSRTWVKLGKPVKAGDTAVSLAEPVTGWKVGDRITLTATTRQNKVKKTFEPSVRDNTQTEERTIAAINGTTITLDQPVKFTHRCEDEYRGEVANLSRNVVIESASPDGIRGHTMYHKNSSGSISYAEFRYLGKRDVLGRYSLHYHLCGDTMRGSSVIGASIHDSHNRWLTIHGTNYLVVRDCVGYHSIGHGYFLEDGTEVFNVFDRNLALQACGGKPLPKQVLPFDHNDGAGFWWANSHNTFTRNVAAECDEYGFRFEVTAKGFDPKLPIRQPDGSRAIVDVRTLPFVRFEDNEAHCQRRHAFNLGGGAPFGEPNVGGVGPDEKHPFVIRNFRAWNTHWAIHPVAPSVLIDGLDVFLSEYGVWRPVYQNHAYRGVKMADVPDATRYAFVTPSVPPNKESDYPGQLSLVDDRPPTTVITHVAVKNGKLLIRGTTADNGTVKKVTVNSVEAKATGANFAEWEAELPMAAKVKAFGEDAAGNVEKTPHEVSLK